MLFLTLNAESGGVSNEHAVDTVEGAFAEAQSQLDREEQNVESAIFEVSVQVHSLPIFFLQCLRAESRFVLFHITSLYIFPVQCCR